MGEQIKGGKPSYQTIDSGQSLTIEVSAAALLDDVENTDIRNRPYSQKPYWHIERARVPGTSNVPVQLIVNGEVVETQTITGNGEIHELTFEYKPKKYSWVALRIHGAYHTNPVFVLLDDEPIRASQESARWCLEAVEVCWNAKKGRIRPDEIGAAKAAWDHARNVYLDILKDIDHQDD